MICRRPLLGLLTLAFLFFAASRLADAQFHGFRHHWWGHGATYLFRNVTIGPGDVVNGDLNVIFGNAVVEGTVTGDVNVIGGTCDVSSGSIMGQVNCVQTASIGSLVPWTMPWPSTYFNSVPFVEQGNRLSFAFAWNLIVFFMFLLFPLRTRLALARVETHPGLSAVIGVLGFVAVVPFAILLALSIVGIPVIVLEIAAVFAGVWIGQGAIALLVGRRLFELMRPNTTPSPLAALILGLVVVGAAEIVPVVGWVVISLTSLIGLGAAILGLVPFVPAIAAGPGGPPGGSGRGTITGPPMTSR